MSTPADPTRTAAHVPDAATAAHAPSPETLPPDAPRVTETFDPDRTTGPDSPAPTPAAEEAVPGYEVLGELGRGGMGVVYRARNTRLNRVVALKMILGRPGTAELMRFRAEAEAMAAVRHPHVAQVYEAGEADGRPFLALELLAGGTLGEARRLVLKQLSRHYNRLFADQWEFVQFVTDNKLPLDLITPPKRPEPKP